MSSETAEVTSSGQNPLKQRRPILEWVAIVLAILGFVPAGITIWLDLTLHRTADRIEENTGQFMQYASTHQIGEFPKDMEDIITTITGTCSTLDIMTDTPGYGIYSSYGDSHGYYYQEYKDGLKSLVNLYEKHNCGSSETSQSKGPRVRLLIFSDAIRNDMNKNEQFPKEMFLSKLKQEQTEKNRLKSFYATYAGLLQNRPPQTAEAFLNELLTGNPDAYQRFLDILSRAESEAADEFGRAGIIVGQTSHRYRLYAWIQDHSKAVFAFQYTPGNRNSPSGGGATAVAFKTTDAVLAHSLEKIFNDEWCQVTPKPTDCTR